jgi:hypothetical protein
VIELRAGPEPADQPVKAGDDLADVADRDLAGADRRTHAQPDQADWDRAAVLPHGHERLGVHARRGPLGGLWRLGGQRATNRSVSTRRRPLRICLTAEPRLS